MSKGDKPTQDLSVASVTDPTLAQMADTPDPRLRAVLGSLVRHLHDFAREMALTPQEWVAAIGFLTRTGQTCTPARQEFVLLSDVLGLSVLVNRMHDCTGATSATEAPGTAGSLLGPFYQQGSPRCEDGGQIARHVTGPLLQVYGQVRDAAGQGGCRMPRCRCGRRIWTAHATCNPMAAR